MKKKASFSRRAKPYLFLAPMLIFALLFVWYPFCRTFLYAFSSVNIRGEITGFSGLENFSYLFGRSAFRTALENTLLLTAVNVPVTLIITLALAALACRKKPLGAIYETLFSLPMTVAVSTAALIFKVMLHPSLGFVNSLLGIGCKWYESRATALWGILLLTVWMGIGFNFLLFLSALRNIPSRLTDAALIDGAGKVRCFFRIQLPLISPVILYVVCTNTVLSLMTAAPVMIIIKDSLKRGCSTLIYLMYSSGYQSSDYSTAACISIIVFLMALGFTLLAFTAERKKVYDL